MNYEQFYYWLKGYVEHGDDTNFVQYREDIYNAMKQVVLPKVLSSATFTSKGSTGIIPLNCP